MVHVRAALAALCWSATVAPADPPAVGSSSGPPVSLTLSSEPLYFAAASPRAEAGMAAPTPAASAASRPADDNVQLRTRLFLAGSVLGVATYGAVKWWENGFTGFRSQSEGWFGADTQKGGADKLGHAFGTYAGVRAGAQVLEMLGNSREDARRLAAVTSLAVFAGIEVLDGFSKNYRFSKEDFLANVAGAGFGWLMHGSPRLDALLDLRLYYHRSPEAKAEGTWEPFADYNGQRYLLAFKASGMPALDAVQALRYVELVVGYGVRGYDPRGTVQSRNVYAGVAINVARVLDDTVFHARRESLVRKGTGTFLELFQLPGTAVMSRGKL